MELQESQLRVRLAESDADIKACQRLRFDIFAGEMGANLPSAKTGLDMDGFDPYCQHLIVEDQVSGKMIACTRILTDIVADRIGGYYSDHEFDLSAIRKLQGRTMEIGRTCVHPEHRNGATIGVLWSGLAAFMLEHHFDFLMGCASVPMTDYGVQVSAIRDSLIEKSLLTEEHRRVRPRVPVSYLSKSEGVSIVWPPLLKAYLRLGAKVCGEPFYDQDFNVADFFILLDVKDLSPRYARHFLQRIPTGQQTSVRMAA